MDTEEIDYKALYEGVQHELEQARLTILKMRHARNPLDKLDIDKVRAFVQKNYVLIILALVAVSYLFEYLIKIKKLRSKGDS